MSQSMGKQRIVSNLVIMGAALPLTWVLGLLWTVLVSRYLGPERAGELGTASAVVAVLGLGVDLGMGTLITRTVAREPERAGTLASAALVLRAVLIVPALGILYAWVHAAHFNAETRAAAFVLAGSMILASVSGIPLATFTGREEMSLNTLWKIGRNALSVVLVALVVWWHGGVVAMAATVVLTEFVLLVVNLRWMRQFGHMTWRVSRSALRDVVIGSFAFWATNIFLTVYIQIDMIILQALAGTIAAGYYGPAMRFYAVTLVVPGMVATVTMPLLSRYGVGAAADFARMSRKTLALLLVVAVPLTIALASFAEPLVIRIFGSPYRPSIPVVEIISLCIVPTFMNIQLSQMLNARDRQWEWTGVMAVSCVVNPLLNVMLIPYAQQHWHNGAAGAALSLVVTELLMTIYGSVRLHAIVWDRSIGGVALAVLAAGAAQSAVLWLWFHAGWWSLVGEAVAGFTYLACALVLGAIPRDDLLFLKATIGGQMRGVLARRARTPTPSA